MVSDFEKLARGTVGDLPLVQDTSGRSWKFVLIYAKGDAQVRCDDWGMRHYNAADLVCPECLGNRSTRPFTDLQPTAAWRATEAMS